MNACQSMYRSRRPPSGGWAGRAALVAVLLLAGGSGHAGVIIENSTANQGGAGGLYYPLSQPFSILQDVANFEILLARKSQYMGNQREARAVLSTVVGPGITPGDIIAERTVPLPTAMFNQPHAFDSIFQLESLAAGDYYLTLSPGDWSLQPSQTASNDFASIGEALYSGFQGTNHVQHAASVFSPFGSNYAFATQIVGDLDNSPAGTPGGNETFFEFRPPIIDGGGVTISGLGAEHGIDAQAIGTQGRVEKSNRLERTFTFDVGSSVGDPPSVEAYIHAYMEGRLIADNLSSASARGTLSILDAMGAVVGYDDMIVEIDAGVRELVTADVFEWLTLPVSLIPGGEYTVVSTLELVVNPGINGAARAFFADTFGYEISGLSTNNFADPTRETVITTGTAVSEPTTLGIFVSSIVALLALRRRRKASTRPVWELRTV